MIRARHCSGALTPIKQGIRKSLLFDANWHIHGKFSRCYLPAVCCSARYRFSGTGDGHNASSRFLQNTRTLLFQHEPPFASHSSPGSERDEFFYDPMEGVQRDAAVETAKKSADAVLRELLPSHAPPEAFAKAQKYLLEHPINELIDATMIHITHVANAEGEEVKAAGGMVRSPCDRDTAIRQAREKGLDVVMMARRGDTAYCRIRNEKNHVLHLVKKELDAAAEAAETAGRPSKVKDLLQHQFRDVVDAHFIGWKSKKIVQELKKGYPVKLVIREFQNWEGAILKMKEMCKAIQRVAEGEKVSHHFSSITANANEVSVMFSPSVNRGNSGNKVVQIKHPIEKEWAYAQKRMEDSCRKSGRFGTYMKAPQLKPRCLGETTYRVDKYGRRIE